MKPHKRLTYVAFFFCTLCLPSLCLSLPETATARPVVKFTDNRLTVRADNEPLIRVLEEVAGKTDIVIFMAKEFEPGNITVRLDDLPLEKAFKKLLKRYNCVTMYNRKGDRFVVTGLKIYPEGKTSGSMKTLVTESVSPSSESTGTGQAGYTPRVPGSTLPGQYVEYALKKDRSQVQIAHGFEQTEKKASSEINELRQKLGQAENPAQKEKLTSRLIKSLAEFETMQRNHTNTMESLYRASLFQKKRKNKQSD